jgi:HEAT repeat protein
MHPLICNLIEQLKSNNRDSMDEAIVLFADIFLIHNARLPEYQQKELLREPYLSLRLTETEQKEVVKALSEILISNPSEPLLSIIWVLSKVPARIGLDPLLDILNNCSDQIGEDRYSGVPNALSKQIHVLEDPENDDYVRAILKAKSPVPFYKKRLESQNPEIAESARESLKFWEEEFGLTE